MLEQINQIGQLAQQYWYIVLCVIGLLLILGSIFKWKWVLQTQGSRPLGFIYWVYTLAGPVAHRIAVGCIGAVIVIFTIIYALLLA